MALRPLIFMQWDLEEYVFGGVVSAAFDSGVYSPVGRFGEQRTLESLRHCKPLSSQRGSLHP